MRSTIKAALATLAIAAGSLAAGPAALADNVTVGVGPGGIAFGYSDGYWDRDHHWHGWRNKEEAERFRAENREHYYDRKHDREEHEGWRESDHWWDRDRR